MLDVRTKAKNLWFEIRMYAPSFHILVEVRVRSILTSETLETEVSERPIENRKDFLLHCYTIVHQIQSQLAREKSSWREKRCRKRESERLLRVYDLP